MGLEEKVELVAHYTGFDPHPTLLGVDLKDVVEVAADVYDDTVAHYLAGDAGATCTGNEVGAATAGLGNQFFDVLLGGGIGHGEGHFAIGRCVGGIGYAVQHVGVECHGSGTISNL